MTTRADDARAQLTIVQVHRSIIPSIDSGFPRGMDIAKALAIGAPTVKHLVRSMVRRA